MARFPASQPTLRLGVPTLCDPARRTAKAFRTLAMPATLALAAAALSGCISPAEMAARHRQACATYGFQPGTEGYANCVLMLDVGDYGYAHHGYRAAMMPHPMASSTAPQAPAPPNR